MGLTLEQIDKSGWSDAEKADAVRVFFEQQRSSQPSSAVSKSTDKSDNRPFQMGDLFKSSDEFDSSAASRFAGGVAESLDPRGIVSGCRVRKSDKA